MTIKELLKKYHKIEIELLLAHVLRKPKEFVFLHPDYKLSLHAYTTVLKYTKRRLEGEPMAYILGYKDFCGLRFKVNKNVLIPRPESEWLVERVVSSIPEFLRAVKNIRDPETGPRRGGLGGTLSILDMGTGSGCIAISLAVESKIPLDITASDISPAALRIANFNTNHYIHTRLYECKAIKFVKSDLFGNIDGKFDIIVANLPYVPLSLLHKFLHHNAKLKPDDPFQGLKYEPAFALSDGTSSWQIYRRFFEQVGNHLSAKSIIYLEIDPSSRKFLTQYQKKYLPGWQIKFYKDFNKLWRYAEIKVKS